jgi:hypothetical protein
MRLWRLTAGCDSPCDSSGDSHLLIDLHVRMHTRLRARIYQSFYAVERDPDFWDLWTRVSLGLGLVAGRGLYNFWKFWEYRM